MGKLRLQISIFGLAGAFLWGMSACQDVEVPAEIAALDKNLPEKIDYNLHIKPLLSDRCFKCHGPDANKREAGLRLDIAEEAYATLKSGQRALVPGSLGKSEVFRRIVSTDHDEMMPTPESNLSLNNEEKALLIRWIQQGAEYKPHWSFVAIEQPDAPEVKNNTWVRNPIDQFVLEPLEKRGIQPSAQATPSTLLHRVYMDLTGLPPSMAQVEAFRQDRSPNAYEKVVDQLLNSPHFGERMAAEWLDLARYADSHGYQDDGLRNAWPYRDWVIGAFNKNLPFDKFVQWQLAGDMLPKPSHEMQLATHFNRSHPQTQEGGVVDEEYRNEYVIDRVNTFGKAFLGISLECARCHDHKYDPVSQKEFYELYAFFNNNRESGIIPYNGEASPTILVKNAEVDAKINFIRAKIAPLEQAILPSHFEKNFQNWLQKPTPPQPSQARKQRINASHLAAAKANPKDPNWQRAILPQPRYVSDRDLGLVGAFDFDSLKILTQKEKNGKQTTQKTLQNKAQTSLSATLAGDPDLLPTQVAGRFGSAMKLNGELGFDFSRELDSERNEPFTISIWVKLFKKGETGPLFQKSNGEFEGHRGYRVWLQPDGTLMVNMSYVWPANCIDLRTTDKLPVGQWAHLALSYDGSSKAKGLKIWLNGRPMKHQVRTDHLHKSILYGERKSHWNDMPFMIGKEFRTTIKDVAFDEMRAYNRQLATLEIAELATGKRLIPTLLQKTNRSSAEVSLLREYHQLAIDSTYRQRFAQLETWREQENQLLTDLPEVMVMNELPQARPTFVLNRGQYDSPTSLRVFPNTPSQLLAFDGSLPRNRVGLAAWLLHQDNPLFARVAVNRFWQLFFGKGIVSTSDDFGNQGALPSHPELLDWLAATFRNSGWNVKALLRNIATSATYRQSSLASNKMREQDPANDWLARGPSYRYSHEQIRDKVLASSGLLTARIGGPSVYPYQPAGLWEALATRNATSYRQQHGDSLYRRGLYTIWKRSSPPPSAIVFDASERYFCMVKRQKTNTPLQSLVLMNDPQYVEAARVLGERMMQEGGPDIQKRIEVAFKALLSRMPRPEERTILDRFYQQEKKQALQNPRRVAELLRVGEKTYPRTLAVADLAACTMVATTLINFDETLMKR
jgi:Protein of unknown function (DUF1553)/Protein of unknown function (DUF1549)/Planctomycete cytochrome C/Concanavalin A-like lectin/glucanases superfamily